MKHLTAEARGTISRSDHRHNSSMNSALGDPAKIREGRRSRSPKHVDVSEAVSAKPETSEAPRRTRRRSRTPRKAVGSEAAAVADDRVVSLDVGGSLFRVSREIIMVHPGTRLANLVLAATDDAPIFVDCAPERFSYIIDWYRDGQINVPQGVSINALMMDAQYLELPAEIVVNGAWRTTGSKIASHLSRELIAGVCNRWRNFEAYMDNTLNAVARHFETLAESSDRIKADNDKVDQEDDVEGDDGYDFAPYVIPLWSEAGWTDPDNICSAARARVLALKLEDLGFVCEFTDTDLFVCLASRLKNEGIDDGGEEDAWEDEEEGHAGYADPE